jgi:hypothetical protein
MNQQVSTIPQPARNRIYGLTHDPLSQEPIVRNVRTVKVGIGVPRGKDIHIWIDATKAWCIQVGKSDPIRFDSVSLDEVRKRYRAAKKAAPERPAPRKVPYFTFTRPGFDGDFDHDLDMIAAHGPTPTEIPICFDQNEPLQMAYQYYTASGLKCEGDGQVARRKNEFAQNEFEKGMAEAAAKDGLRVFPIVNGCALHGCPFANSDKPACKPHARMVFQLMSAMRMGGSAQFDTTGKRSISQLYSCIQRFKEATGRGDAERGWIGGIPLFLVVRPYRTQKPDGAPTTQFGVALEYRGESVAAMRREMIGYATEFQQAAGMLPELDLAPGQILPPANDVTVIPMIEAPGIESEDDPVDAAAMDAEFYGNFPPEPDDEPAAEPEPAIQMPQRKSQK